MSVCPLNKCWSCKSAVLANNFKRHYIGRGDGSSVYRIGWGVGLLEFQVRKRHGGIITKTNPPEERKGSLNPLVWRSARKI